VIGGGIVGAMLVFLAFFFGIRVGESGARVMLDSLKASAASGTIVRLEDGRTFWCRPAGPGADAGAGLDPAVLRA